MTHTTDERAQLLHEWISQQFTIINNSFSPVSGDASFRRYFRFMPQHESGASAIDSLIAVDAPPEQENSQPFITIAALLEKHQLPVPQIFHVDLKRGFYIQQDFGDQLLLDLLNDETVDSLYEQAMNTIVRMQQVDCIDLPAYDKALLHREMDLFSQWYLHTHLQASLSASETQTVQSCYDLLESSAREQPQAFVHRDYHSRNLMVVDKQGLGIIDFQDAVKGPITYDLVSLLRDCYIAWPQNKIDDWLEYFYQQLQPDYSLQQFTRWFDFMGMQRHLKAAGIFCRLNYRDGKPAYLNDIPRTLNYIATVSSKYAELAAFNQLIRRLL